MSWAIALVITCGCGALLAAKWLRSSSRLPSNVPTLSTRTFASLARAIASKDTRTLLDRFTKDLLPLHGGAFQLPGVVGKPFLIMGDPSGVRDMRTVHAACFEKQHANGILEIFRQTTLPVTQVDAWRATHKLATRLIERRTAREGGGTQLDALLELVDRMIHTCTSAGASFDVAEAIQEWYWDLTLTLVLGEVPATLGGSEGLYSVAWRCCIERLGSPWINGVSWWKLLPTAANRKYARSAAALRAAVSTCIERVETQSDGVTPTARWSVKALMHADTAGLKLAAAEDRLEVAMELLFTGTTSLTSTLVWLMWHLVEEGDGATQRACRAEANEWFARHERGDASLATLTRRDAMPTIDCCLRETLRMYAPIHVGRHCLKDVALAVSLFTVTFCENSPNDLTCPPHIL